MTGSIRHPRTLSAVAIAVASIVGGAVTYSISIASAASSAPEIATQAAPAGGGYNCDRPAPDIEHYRSGGQALPQLLSFHSGALVAGDACGDNGGGGGGGGGGGTPLDCSSVAPEYPFVGAISGTDVTVSTGGYGATAPTGCSPSISTVTVNAYACSTTTYSSTDCSTSLGTWTPFDCCTTIWGLLAGGQTVDPISSFLGKPYLILKIDFPVFNSGDSSNETVTAYSLARVAGTPPTATFQVPQP